jgi:DNA-binding NarL/FixJ family response regulator
LSEIKNVLAQQELEEDSEFSLVSSLSKREIEIVQYVKKGFSSREIALQLDIGMKTVEVHRYNILRKLHLKNSASLINFFNTNGI